MSRLPGSVQRIEIRSAQGFRTWQSSPWPFTYSRGSSGRKAPRLVRGRHWIGPTKNRLPPTSNKAYGRLEPYASFHCRLKKGSVGVKKTSSETLRRRKVRTKASLAVSWGRSWRFSEQMVNFRRSTLSGHTSRSPIRSRSPRATCNRGGKLVSGETLSKTLLVPRLAGGFSPLSRRYSSG